MAMTEFKISARAAFIAVLVIRPCVAVLADEEAANQPVVRSSEYGSVYAKSVPAESYGQKGKTSVLAVGADRDTLLCEYDWYANEIYIGGAAGHTVIRFGPWQRGRKPQKDHIAIGIYRHGRTVKEYSTADMDRMGSGVSISKSHYTIFKQRLGFRVLRENIHVYEAQGVSGKTLMFDLQTGTVIDEITEKPAEGEVESEINRVKDKTKQSGHTYEDKTRGFKVTIPSGWSATPASFSVQHYRDVFLCINNQGNKALRVVHKREGNTETYGPAAAAEQLKPGTVYIDFAYFEGPGGTRNTKGIADTVGKMPFSEKLKPSKFADEKISRLEYSFIKHERRWHVYAYFREPVKDDVRTKAMELLRSFEFSTLGKNER
jgi:hypothetical protein